MPRLPSPAPPSSHRESHTDLDLLLVVVNLPGDVYVHGAPLSWFLEQERTAWSGGRHVSMPTCVRPRVPADLGHGDLPFFHENRRAWCQSHASVSSSSSLRHEGVRTPTPLSHVGLRPGLLYNAVLCRGQDGKDLTLSVWFVIPSASGQDW